VNIQDRVENKQKREGRDTQQALTPPLLTLQDRLYFVGFCQDILVPLLFYHLLSGKVLRGTARDKTVQILFTKSNEIQISLELV